jgi:hypothetical protein
VKSVWNIGDKKLFVKHKRNKPYEIKIGLLTETVLQQKAKAIDLQQE